MVRLEVSISTGRESPHPKRSLFDYAGHFVIVVSRFDKGKMMFAEPGDITSKIRFRECPPSYVRQRATIRKAQEPMIQTGSPRRMLTRTKGHRWQHSRRCSN